MQGFKLAAKSVSKIVEFSKGIEMAEEIFKKGDVSHTNKNPIIPVQTTTQPHWINKKGQTRLINYQKRMIHLNLKIG